MKRAMVELDREVIDWDEVIMHLTVHDEADMSIPRGERGDRVLRDSREIMANAVKLSLPILVGVDVGENWGHLTEWEG
jgi:DNA polymerase I-like protein with 3'-5' exonuclease and polymerase domains